MKVHLGLPSFCSIYTSGSSGLRGLRPPSRVIYSTVTLPPTAEPQSGDRRNVERLVMDPARFAMVFQVAHGIGHRDRARAGGG